MSLVARRSALEVQRMILRKFAPELQRKVSEAIENKMQDVVVAIAKKTPISDDNDPGQLQDSVRTEVKGNKILLLAGGDSAPHALHVEFGTRKMEAQPYFYPTWRKWRKRVFAAPAAALREMTAKYSAK